MSDQTFTDGSGLMSRRAIVRMIGTAAGGAAIAPQVLAQQTRSPAAPNPARTGASGVISLRDFGAVCDGATDDYAALAAAVRAMTGFPGGELVIPGVTKIGTNITIPEEMALRFPRGGMLRPINGRTITVNGPWAAGPYPTIDASLGGGVTFRSNSLQRDYMAEWWNIPRGGTTDAVPALNRMIAAIPDHSTIRFVYKTSMRFAQQWIIAARVGLRIVSEPAIEELPALEITDQFPFSGSSPALIYLAGCGHCTVEGFWFKTSVIGYGVKMDQTGQPRISTNNIISKNRFSNLSGNAGWVGIAINPSGGANNEFMHITGNYFEGAGRTGAGIYAGSDPNNHGHIIEDNTFIDLAKGITAAWTGYTARHNHFTQNALDFEITHLSYPTVIEDNGSEESRQFYKAGAAGGESSVILRSNRLASLGAAGVAWIELGEFIGPTTLIGNDYQNYNRNNSRLYSFPWNGAGNYGIGVNLIGNNYGNILNQGMPAANVMVRTGNSATPVRLPINLNGDALPGAR